MAWSVAYWIEFVLNGNSILDNPWEGRCRSMTVDGWICPGGQTVKINLHTCACLKKLGGERYRNE